MDDAERGVLAERIEGLLTGQRVKLYPYVRGMWPPETLFTLWKLMQEDGPADPQFVGGIGQAHTRYPTRGDLVDFVKFCEPDPPAERVMLMAQSLEHAEDMVGLFWFDDLVPGHRAAASVFYFRRFWGELAREASRLALSYGFEVLGVESVWAYTPWRTGRRHAEAAGMRLVATLPGYVIAEEGPMDLAILRITREELDNG